MTLLLNLVGSCLILRITLPKDITVLCPSFFPLVGDDLLIRISNIAYGGASNNREVDLLKYLEVEDLLSVMECRRREMAHLIDSNNTFSKEVDRFLWSLGLEFTYYSARMHT